LRLLALPFVLAPGLLPLTLAGCNAGYSPNTYASSAAQEEATVQRGIIIGVRQVMIAASGTIGAAAGGAAGGVAGAQVSGGPVATGLGVVGGALVGGIGGTAAAQAVANTKGWEYIVQEDGDKLVSVTQTSKTALLVGQHVLVISDSQQARIVPDYTVQIAATPPSSPQTSTALSGSPPTEINLSPLLPPDGMGEPLQIAPIALASDPAVPSAASPDSADPTPEAVNNKISATGTPSTETTAPSVPAAPGAPVSGPPASASAEAPP
jgi:outer membrane lipoprotein SlyB